MDAFTLALKLGATGLETDIWLTKDGLAVLDHDGLVRRRGRQRPLASVNRSALPEHIPTLTALLPICGPTTHVSIDVRDPGAGAVIVDTVRSERPDLLPRIWLCASDVGYLTELRALDPSIRLVNSTRLNRIKEGLERRAATLRERRIDAVNLHHSEWTGGLTVLFHRFERCCFAWDLQHEHLLRAALDLGMDGVYSDWVDRMTDVLATVGRPAWPPS
jgi:glycerophosphoryl diester phosphodiesterase